MFSLKIFFALAIVCLLQFLAFRKYLDSYLSGGTQASLKNDYELIVADLKKLNENAKKDSKRWKSKYEKAKAQLRSIEKENSSSQHSDSPSKGNLAPDKLIYDTSCQRECKPPGNYDVALFYHVGMLRNWKEVVHDQLKTLDKCGLGSMLSNFTVSYSNGSGKNLTNVFREYSFASNATMIPSDSIPWEGKSMYAMKQFCQRTTKKTVVFYFHSKGVSRFEPNWRKRLGIVWTYSRSFYWRKYMEWFTIERPALCILSILNGASTCGVELKPIPSWHYSGNFWVASCDYISTLPDKEFKSYIDSELWIGTNFPKTKKVDSELYISLHNSHSELYRHLIVPEEYAFVNISRILGGETGIYDRLKSPGAPSWKEYLNWKEKEKCKST